MTYAAADQLSRRLSADGKGVTGASVDEAIAGALLAADEEIENYCGRVFTDAGSASARTFRPPPATDDVLLVDDFWTTTGLAVAVDADGDGVFETSWTLGTHYQLEPLNAPDVFYRIRPIGSLLWPAPTRAGRAAVQVTARWGWENVPASVTEASLIIAAKLVKMREAPFGVVGWGDFGALRVRDIPEVRTLLNRYVRGDQLGF